MLKPGMFAHGLEGLDSDGPGCKATMKAVRSDVEKVIEATCPLIERALLEEMLRVFWHGPCNPDDEYPALFIKNFAKEKRNIDLLGEG